MKILILFVLTLISASAELVVELTGVRNAKGKVGILVFSSANGFPEDGKKALHEVQTDAKKGKVVFKLPALKNGQYAFTVLHDENGNQKLDKNLIGYPKEGVAISNYQKLARPKFPQAAIKNPKSPVKLKMLYP